MCAQAVSLIRPLARCALYSFRCSRHTHTQPKNCIEDILARTFKSRSLANPNSVITMVRTIQDKQIFERYWKVAKVMHERNLIPLVHGQKSLWMITQKILQTLGFDHGNLLRLPAATLSSAEISKKVHEIAEDEKRHPIRRYMMSKFILAKIATTLRPSLSKKARLDHRLDSYLLSTTLGIFHAEHDESPCSFVLGGAIKITNSYVPVDGNRSRTSSEACMKISFQMISYAMQTRGYPQELIDKFLHELRSLYVKASYMYHGQFLVIGVPKQALSTYSYHCSTFGTPSGIPMDTLIDMVSEEILPKEGLQVRLILCEETLQDNNLKVINIMNEEDVQKFCEGSVPVDTTVLQEALETISKTFSIHPQQKSTPTREFDNLKQDIDQVTEKLSLLKV